MDRKYLQDHISEELWNKAKIEIGKHGQQIGNDNIIFNNSIGVTFQQGRYIGLSLKRVHVINSSFKQCLFDKCAATGSEFKNTKFIDCQIQDSNFQYTNFTNSEFVNQIPDVINMLGCNLCDSNFTKTIFKDIKMQASSFSQSVFANSIIDSCEISSCTLEGASFNGAKLSNMILTNLNVEYADFCNTSFDNVYLPLMQLPYTFGGMNYYFNNDGIKLRSFENQIYRDLSKAEYDKLLFYLKVYFQKTQQYFPLANIHLYEKEKEKFHECIMLGIQLACFNKNLRDVKHLVKLIKLSEWYDAVQLRSLYFKIIDFLQLNMEDPVYLQEVKSHFGEIYSLLGQQKEEDIIVRFVIEDNETKELTLANKLTNNLIKEIANSKCDIAWKNINISKNSPLDIAISFICERPELLVACIGVIGTWLFGALQLKQGRKNNKQNQNLKGNNIIIDSNNEIKIDNRKTINITNITIYCQGNIITNKNEIDNFINNINNQLKN